MLGFFMSVFIVYGFDTAGSFGEETVDAGRQAPRGVLSSIWISGLVGTVFLLAVILSIQDIPGQMAAGLAGEFPIANTILANLTGELAFGITLGELYLVVILVSVFVCTLAIQGAATRMMFSMGRDRHLPFGRVWGNVNQTFKTPANAAIARRRAGGAADPAGRPDRRLHAVDCRHRPDLPELLPVQPRRGPRPHAAAGRTTRPGSSLVAGGRWSTSWR